MRTWTCLAPLLAAAAILSACHKTGPSAPLPGYYPGLDISPTGSLQLGGVYRSAVPVTKQTPLPEVSEMCMKDFQATTALAALRAKYADAAGVGKLDESRSSTSKLGLGAEGVKLSWLTVGGTYQPTTTTTADFKGVTYAAMEPEDADTVLQHLGAACKKLIKNYQAKRYGIYIPAGTYKAKTVSITTKIDDEAKVEAGIKVLGTEPGLNVSHTNNSSVTVSGENMFYKIVPVDIPKP